MMGAQIIFDNSLTWILLLDSYKATPCDVSKEDRYYLKKDERHYIEIDVSTLPPKQREVICRNSN